MMFENNDPELNLILSDDDKKEDVKDSNNLRKLNLNLPYNDDKKEDAKDSNNLRKKDGEGCMHSCKCLII